MQINAETCPCFQRGNNHEITSSPEKDDHQKDARGDVMPVFYSASIKTVFQKRLREKLSYVLGFYFSVTSPS